MVDRRLGRGLDFFLSGNRQPAPTPPPVVQPAAPAASLPDEVSETKAAGDEVMLVELDRLVPNPNQPRKVMEERELQQLADSIRTNGILQPILARKAGTQLEVVAGERRWRAAKLAGLTHVPVLVRNIDEQDSAVFALVENVQREDLNAIEKAQGFKLLMDRLGATQEVVAKKVGFDRSTVTNFLRLLDLPAEVQAHVSRGTLTMGHARSLLALPDAAAMTEMATSAIREALSVRALETKVKGALEASAGTGSGASPKKSTRPVWVNELEENLVDALGSPVHIRYSRNRTQITIECGNREDFERVYQRLKNA